MALAAPAKLRKPLLRVGERGSGEFREIEWDEALALVKRAEELDPLMHRSDVASTLVRAGRYEEALESARHAVSFDPQHGRSNSTLGWALIKLGRFDEGLASLERAVAANPESTMYLAQLGQAYAVTGDTARAREALRTLDDIAKKRYVSPYHLAYVYTGLGDADRAIDLLERAFDDGRAGEHVPGDGDVRAADRAAPGDTIVAGVLGDAALGIDHVELAMGAAGVGLQQCLCVPTRSASWTG